MAFKVLVSISEVLLTTVVLTETHLTAWTSLSAWINSLIWVGFWHLQPKNQRLTYKGVFGCKYKIFTNGLLKFKNNYF